MPRGNGHGSMCRKHPCQIGSNPAPKWGQTGPHVVVHPGPAVPQSGRMQPKLGQSKPESGRSGRKRAVSRQIWSKPPISAYRTCTFELVRNRLEVGRTHPHMWTNPFQVRRPNLTLALVETSPRCDLGRSRFGGRLLAFIDLVPIAPEQTSPDAHPAPRETPGSGCLALS